MNHYLYICIKLIDIIWIAYKNNLEHIYDNFIWNEQLLFEMQQQQVRHIKQNSTNKKETYELETSIISQNKNANLALNHQINNQSSINNINIEKKELLNNKQNQVKQKRFNDSKQQNKSIKPYSNQKIETPSHQLQKNVKDHSQGQKSSDSSLSSNQKTKKDIDAKKNDKKEMQKQQKSSSSSSESKSSSSEESSPSNKPLSEKPSKIQMNKIQPVLKKTIEIKKDKDNTNKDAVSKTQKQTTPLPKKSQTKIKKVKGSDQESDYAPNKRQAKRNRKSKQQIKTKISEDQSSEAKYDIKPAQKIKNKDTSTTKNIASKPLISNKLTSTKTSKHEQKKTDQKPEHQTQNNLIKQRNLRTKKPTDYKSMQEDQINRSAGSKIPYRGRYKQMQKSALPPTVEASLNDIIKNIPTQSKQTSQKMQEQSQEKKIQSKVQMISQKPKTVKYKLSMEEVKEKPIINTINNPKIDVESKNQKNVGHGTNVSTNILEIIRPIRSREQYQKSHENGKKKDNLTLQSRIIVESILIKMDNSNNPNFNFLQSEEDMKQKVKLFYSLFPHAPCCPLSIQGIVRKKKIVEKQQYQDQQIVEKTSTEMVKIEDAMHKESLSNIKLNANHNRNLKNVGNNKSSKKRKVSIPEEESEEIVIKRPAKRLRQGRD